MTYRLNGEKGTQTMTEENTNPTQEPAPEVEKKPEPRTIVIQKIFKAETEFDKFLWALKVRSTDPMRKPLHGIYVHNGWGVCTDGHRLHMFKLELRDIAPGLYFPSEGATNKKLIVLQTDTEGHTFPDYGRVIPTAKPDQWITFTTRDTWRHDPLYTYIVYQLGLYEIPYLEDAFLPNRTITMNGYTMNKREKPWLEILEYSTTLDKETNKEVNTLIARALIMPISLSDAPKWKFQTDEPEPTEPEPAAEAATT